MQFGYTNAPAQFQYLIMHVLDGEDADIPRPRNATYLDDISVPGLGVPQLWEDTLFAVARLASAGLPVGIEKC